MTGWPRRPPQRRAQGPKTRSKVTLTRGWPRRSVSASYRHAPSASWQTLADLHARSKGLDGDVIDIQALEGAHGHGLSTGVGAGCFAAHAHPTRCSPLLPTPAPRVTSVRGFRYPDHTLSEHRPPSALRVLTVSFGIVWRVSARALRRRAGGALTFLLQGLFLVGVVGQVAVTFLRQHQRLVSQLTDVAGGDRAAAQVAQVFLLDVLGVVLLLPAAMIRADGIAGKQRAAVDTELWLTLPLDGPQRVLARLGQASFFLSLLFFFLLSHFLGPALAFGPTAPAQAALFLLLSLSALLLILGAGVGAYALVRRYLPPRRQGQLVAWASLSLLPLGYAYTLVVRGAGAPAALWARLLPHVPVAGLLRAALRRDLWAAAFHGLLLLGGAALLFALGLHLTRRVSREAVDDLAPLVASRRYPGPPRPLSFLGKDLRLSLRDPIHRGVFISAWLVVLLPQIITLLFDAELTVLVRTRLGEQNALGVASFFLGLSVMLASALWVPLEARSSDWLRVMGVEPLSLLRRKAFAASLQALLLSLPVCALLLRQTSSRALRWQPLWLIPYALAVAWFMVGDTAARLPESRRDTRPVQLRSIYAGYLLVLLASVMLPISAGFAALALLFLLLMARARLRRGARALARGDDILEGDE